jgi:hypothetical protein
MLWTIPRIIFYLRGFASPSLQQRARHYRLVEKLKEAYEVLFSSEGHDQQMPDKDSKLGEAAAHLKRLAELQKEYQEERKRFGRARIDPP